MKDIIIVYFFLFILNLFKSNCINQHVCNYTIDQQYTEMWASQVALVVKNPPAKAGDVRDTDLISGWGRSPGERHGNLLQYTCLENATDRGVC